MWEQVYAYLDKLGIINRFYMQGMVERVSFFPSSEICDHPVVILTPRQAIFRPISKY